MFSIEEENFQEVLLRCPTCCAMKGHVEHCVMCCGDGYVELPDRVIMIRVWKGGGLEDREVNCIAARTEHDNDLDSMLVIKEALTKALSALDKSIPRQ